VLRIVHCSKKEDRFHTETTENLRERH
jgi:hypothetical protein